MRGACFAFFSRSILIPSSSSVLVPLVKASLASSSSSFLPLLPLEKNRKRLYFTAAREKQTPFGWREREKVSFAISFLFSLFSPLLSPAAAPSLPLYTFFTKPPPRQKEEEEEEKKFFDFTVRAHLCKPRTHFAGGEKEKEEEGGEERKR